MMLANRIIVSWPPYTEADGFEITPMGRKYSDSTELIMREERSASGKLRRDVIALKKTFTMQYSAIDQTNLDKIQSVLTNHAAKELRLDVDRLDPQTGTISSERYTVLMSPYSRERILSHSGGLWGNVTLTFVEV